MKQEKVAESEQNKGRFMRKGLALMIAFMVCIMSVFTTESAFAAIGWPGLSSSKYCEYTATKTINVYRDTALKTRGTSSPSKSYSAYISKNDVCRIYKITSSYAQINYPTSNGRRTGYVSTKSLFNGKTAPVEAVTSKGKVTTYVMPGGKTYGNTTKGDKVYVCGTSSGYTAIIYIAKSGSRAYKYGWVTTNNYNSYVKGQATLKEYPAGAFTINNGEYHIVSALDNSKTLNIKSYSKENGANVQIWNKDAKQTFNVTYLNNGYYKITSKNSGKSLDVKAKGIKSGTNVQQWDYAGTTNQQWVVKAAGDGTFYIIARNSGLYLDVSGGKNANGTNVQVYTGNGTASQKWKFVKATAPSVKVQLNVPLYKQNDKRWKNTKIGSKTIGQIGCTTTSIAMVYSYKVGKTVYPNSMKSKLRYSNNDLSWGSLSNVGLTSKEYNARLTNSMLKTIYDKLKDNKPVIIGAVTSSGGSQHWVVITGYKGTSASSFSTANFIVNDPGTANSTTLKAFLANGSKADRTIIKRIVY